VQEDTVVPFAVDWRDHRHWVAVADVGSHSRPWVPGFRERLRRAPGPAVPAISRGSAGRHRAATPPCCCSAVPDASGPALH